MVPIRSKQTVQKCESQTCFAEFKQSRSFKMRVFRGYTKHVFLGAAISFQDRYSTWMCTPARL